MKKKLLVRTLVLALSVLLLCASSAMAAVFVKDDIKAPVPENPITITTTMGVNFKCPHCHFKLPGTATTIVVTGYVDTTYTKIVCTYCGYVDVRW